MGAPPVRGSKNNNNEGGDKRRRPHRGDVLWRILRAWFCCDCSSAQREWASATIYHRSCINGVMQELSSEWTIWQYGNFICTQEALVRFWIMPVSSYIYCISVFVFRISWYAKATFGLFWQPLNVQGISLWLVIFVSYRFLVLMICRIILMGSI